MISEFRKIVAGNSFLARGGEKEQRMISGRDTESEVKADQCFIEATPGK